ncbi:MAG: hypothetical protein WC881_01705, partial [Elusimicrobiota bacterium]
MRISLSRVLAFVLSALIFLLAPGPEAWAAAVRAGMPIKGVPTAISLPRAPLLSRSSGLTNPLSLPLPTGMSNMPRVSATALAQPGPSAISARPAAAPLPVLPRSISAAAPAQSAPAAEETGSARTVLESAAAALRPVQDAAENRQVLDRIFSAAKSFLSGSSQAPGSNATMQRVNNSRSPVPPLIHLTRGNRRQFSPDALRLLTAIISGPAARESAWRELRGVPAILQELREPFADLLKWNSPTLAAELLDFLRSIDVAAALDILSNPALAEHPQARALRADLEQLQKHQADMSRLVNGVKDLAQDGKVEELLAQARRVAADLSHESDLTARLRLAAIEEAIRDLENAPDPQAAALAAQRLREQLAGVANNGAAPGSNAIPTANAGLSSNPLFWLLRYPGRVFVVMGLLPIAAYGAVLILPGVTLGTAAMITLGVMAIALGIGIGTWGFYKAKELMAKYGIIDWQMRKSALQEARKISPEAVSVTQAIFNDKDSRTAAFARLRRDAGLTQKMLPVFENIVEYYGNSIFEDYSGMLLGRIEDFKYEIIKLLASSGQGEALEILTAHHADMDTDSPYSIKYKVALTRLLNQAQKVTSEAAALAHAASALKAPTDKEELSAQARSAMQAVAQDTGLTARLRLAALEEALKDWETASDPQAAALAAQRLREQLAGVANSGAAPGSHAVPTADGLLHLLRHPVLAAAAALALLVGGNAAGLLFLQGHVGNWAAALFSFVFGIGGMITGAVGSVRFSELRSQYGMMPGRMRRAITKSVGPMSPAAARMTRDIFDSRRARQAALSRLRGDRALAGEMLPALAEALDYQGNEIYPNSYPGDMLPHAAEFKKDLIASLESVGDERASEILESHAEYSGVAGTARTAAARMREGLAALARVEAWSRRAQASDPGYADLVARANRARADM